jgi:PhzF family phenazine biosynthesis protein
VPRPFAQVDVFTAVPYAGNPVAVVLDADGLSTDAMQGFARWTNLSETTFILPPRAPGADYRVRIFTPAAELPFAGHPTLGSCHAWLEAGGVPRRETVVQECGAGLVRVRRTEDGLAFAAPPLLRGGPVQETLVAEIAAVLAIDRSAIVDAQWADNGPGWVAVLLESADAVLALRPAPPRWTSASSARIRPARRRPSRCGRSSPSTARSSRTRSPGASTRRWRSGCWARAVPTRRTSRGRELRSGAREGSSSASTTRAPSGWQAGR